MRTVFKKVYGKIRKWTESDIGININSGIVTERLGTPYGGWIIPANFLHSQSVCYLVGAGEDISFDLAVANQFGCTVDIFDPTPRAIKHIENVLAGLKNGAPAACATSPGGHYPAYPSALAKLLRFHAFGIWDTSGTLAFFAPDNDAYVSHSLVNLQNSDQSIEVPVHSLPNVLQDLQHKHIDLLKLDVEGAEYQILNSILKAEISVNVLCIEYDETAANHLDWNYLKRIKNSLTSLQDAGFEVIAKEPHCRNYTLIHRRCLDQSVL